MRFTYMITAALALASLASCQQSNKDEAATNKAATTEIASNDELQKKFDEQTRNKEVVLAFYQQMFGDKDVTAVDTYILPDYIQHNPYVADGAEPFKQAAKGWFEGQPKTKIDVQRIAADGDLVFIHVRSKSATGKDVSVIDIFRLENGKIAEHWDAIQEVPEQSANAHPMF